MALTDFKIAFQVTDFIKSLPLDEPNMVRWQVEIVESSGIDVWHKKWQVGVHKCTEAD
jgi:hypothetical protein